MLDIISLGDYYAPLEEGHQLPELREQVNSICGERFRRIDRFIQLCLLGSARCVQGQNLDSQTGLYIGSRFAAICNTIKVQEQMFMQGQIPKPANFINTLSNSAGYYVARNLGLEGKNIFVSRANASLEAALQLAQIDLQAGIIDQALIGVVDEGVPGQAAHCQRMDIPQHSSLGEGSHWFLVTKDSNKESQARIVEVETLSDKNDLRAWLKKHETRDINTFLYPGSSGGNTVDCDPVGTGVNTNSASVEANANANAKGLYQLFELYDPGLAYYPSQVAGVLLCFIREKMARQERAALITLCADPAGRTHVTYTEVA